MDKLVKEENLQGAFQYLDNITIAGHTQEQHDQNVQHFLEVINKRNLTLNATKTIRSAKWIQNFSAKIQPLARVKKFPLNEEALLAFELLKQEFEGATLHSVDENLPFEVECDALEVAVSAVLNQSGRPVAFMSRTLQGS
ncbi:uncharacterized protein LOC135226625 [Macrobrachium nipponense]|uniref:uncharacterized protein LOC135226625 n=1 Tax=Macrobrachium nipponense TaxID=159736 RepID=UPI0030C81B81